MSRVRSRLGRLRRGLRRSAPEPHPGVIALSDEERDWITRLYDGTTPLPPGAEAELREDSPRLADLRRRYSALNVPATVASRWTSENVETFFDLRYFRGETLVTWHYRELKRITELKYFVFLRYVRDRDTVGLLDRLDEDGAFGCWTYEYPGYGRFSRDLIESVNELGFLERELGIASRSRFSVLDVGAGYGRLAHRMSTAFPRVDDYCCVDAVPESTFVSSYYLRARGLQDRTRVVALDEVDDALEPGSFDLAVNIHSFSECPLAAIEWWLERVGQLEIPYLLVVPNEPDRLLSLEQDGSRRDFLPLVEGAGYSLTARERIIEDPAVRELLRLEDSFFLFRRPEAVS